MTQDKQRALAAKRSKEAQAEAKRVNAAYGGWHPIETAPRHTKQMFVVQAFDVLVRGHKYTTDPYCVWAEKAEFVRWPHQFDPTHWMPLPPPPSDTGAETP